MSENHIRNVVEAALLAAGKSLGIADLAQLFDEDGRPEKPQLVAALQQLESEYADRGIELKETASGWRIQIKQGYGREVSRLWPERPQRYSRALLETLALVAYRQPITRAEIESVRGVAVNPNIIKTLMERDWVQSWVIAMCLDIRSCSARHASSSITLVCAVSTSCRRSRS